MICEENPDIFQECIEKACFLEIHRFFLKKVCPSEPDFLGIAPCLVGEVGLSLPKTAYRIYKNGDPISGFHNSGKLAYLEIEELREQNICP